MGNHPLSIFFADKHQDQFFSRFKKKIKNKTISSSYYYFYKKVEQGVQHCASFILYIVGQVPFPRET